jgi:hypothetical protein
MEPGHWHSPEGDLLISIPDEKVVIAIDAFSAGATPFMNLDLTQNMHEYLKFFDRVGAIDFDVMVPGHHGTPATKEDLQIAKSYVSDVYQTAARILAEDHHALKTRAAQKYGDNSWAIASVLIYDTANVRKRSRAAGSGAWRASTFGHEVTAALRRSMRSGM